MAIVYSGGHLGQAMQLASDTGQWLDLDDSIWRWDDPILVSGVLKVRNGNLEYGGKSGQTVLTIEGSIVAVDVSWRKIQFTGITGLDLLGAVRSSFTRCNFDNFRNGDCLALRFNGCAIGRIIACDFTENDRHVEILNSTDIKVVSGGSMITGIGTNGQSSVLVKNSTHTLFDAISIENSRRGPLVELDNARRTFFTSTRFEDVSTLVSGTHSHIESKNGCLDTSFIGCSWNNTNGTNGARPPLIADDGTGDRFYMANSVVPKSSPTVSDNMKNKLYNLRTH